jgi:hypothetical protein
MAKTQGFLTAEQCDALRALGIEPNDTVRAVIDIQVGRPIRIYVEAMGDAQQLDLHALLGAPDAVEVIRPGRIGEPRVEMTDAEVEQFKQDFLAIQQPGRSTVLPPHAAAEYHSWPSFPGDWPLPGEQS